MARAKNSGIPTVYNGVQFRSRLEARWACFFDLCGWHWQYELADLAGWIPDFLITPYRATKDANFALCSESAFWVEVRPGDLQDGLVEKVTVAQSGRKWRDVLLLGDGPQAGESKWFDVAGQMVTVFSNRIRKKYTRLIHFAVVIVGGIHSPELVVRHGDDSYAATLLQMGYSGDCLMLDADTNIALVGEDSREIGRRLWIEAGNRVQWKGAQNHG